MEKLKGKKIEMGIGGELKVPDDPIIPYIEGDGIGPDIWNISVKVLDSAVEKAYGGKKKIEWKEVFAGEKSWLLNGKKEWGWLPEETVETIRDHLVAIKGPMTTPVGGGIRSINVALRQKLDLYVCLRPVRYIRGVPSPVKKPELIDMVIFRENTEDIYAGIEFKEGSEEVKKVKDLLKELGYLEKVRFPGTASIGMKPISKEGTKRLVRSAIRYAIEHRKESVTLVHKGNIMKYTEGYFRDWGYEVAKEEFGGKEIGGGPWCEVRNPRNGGKIVIKDSIADAFLQQILMRGEEYSVIATMNLNGDYISDALAAQVGGIGIAPGANINHETGVAIFEATHGTAPKYAGLDKVNPSSLLLSGELMLRYMGWKEAADLVMKGIEKSIGSGKMTYDFARLMKGQEVSEVSCSGFGESVISEM